MSLTKETYKEHLKTEHKTSVLSDYVKEIIYGGNDGIVTTFAVVSGFTGASTGSHQTVQFSITAVLLFGLANLVADGASMGLGNFLSLRAQKNMYRYHKEKEIKEIQAHPNMEREETIYLLQEKGYSPEDAKALCKLYMKNEAYWLEFMMNQELKLPNPEGENPILNGIATFTSFVVFGFIPIIPYLVTQNVRNAFIYSALSGMGALIGLGILSGMISRRHYIKTVFETLLVGSTAGTLAFLVGRLF